MNLNIEEVILGAFVTAVTMAVSGGVAADLSNAVGGEGLCNGVGDATEDLREVSASDVLRL